MKPYPSTNLNWKEYEYDKVGKIIAEIQLPVGENQPNIIAITSQKGNVVIFEQHECLGQENYERWIYIPNSISIEAEPNSSLCEIHLIINR